jgi:hypothetical protein
MKMRLTVKAKLAGAFGVVIILSMITGGIAYTKLTALNEEQLRIVAQAGRMKGAADIMDGIQGQQRAETRMIEALSDKDTQDNYDAMLARRTKVLKLRDELYSEASEVGKRALDQAVCAAQFKQKGCRNLEGPGTACRKRTRFRARRRRRRIEQGCLGGSADCDGVAGGKTRHLASVACDHLGLYQFERAGGGLGHQGSVATA